MAERITAIQHKNGDLEFDNFYVRKQKEDSYGVFLKSNNKFITAGETCKKACQKAKLLQIGYDQGYKDSEDIWNHSGDPFF